MTTTGEQPFATAAATSAPAAPSDGAATEHHGRIDYYIVGETTESDGSSAGLDMAAAAGDAAAAGGLAAAAAGVAAAPPAFRFSRLGPEGPDISAPARRKLARAMTVRRNQSGPIPAGFTYLGQFIDHDLTFDGTKVALGEDISVPELIQLRSPSLDLDCLYGRGPTRPGSRRFFAADGLRLKMGTTAPSDGGGNADIAMRGFDLPRVAGEEFALIPDKRNDENLAVAQTHLAMIRFHNRVIARLARRGVPEERRFARARAMVVRHYQWMIRTDFLPRIVEPAIVDDVFRNGRKIFETGAAPDAMPTMPIEFSVAAFRLGHSMVRSTYDWNRVFFGQQGTLGLLFNFSGTGGFLKNGVRLPSNWIADFRRLYDFNEAGRPDLTVPAEKFNLAMRLDTRLVDPLADLPEGTFGGSPTTPAIERNLAFRNLARAQMLNLATGQQMADLLASRGVPVTPLTRSQIVNGNGGADLDALDDEERRMVARRTPLWFYALRESETGNGRLRGVGGRIVAETFHRAMEGSTLSIVREPTWRPNLGPNNRTFRMVDLLLFAFQGRRELLAPLGDQP